MGFCRVTNNTHHTLIKRQGRALDKKRRRHDCGKWRDHLQKCYRHLHSQGMKRWTIVRLWGLWRPITLFSYHYPKRAPCKIHSFPWRYLHDWRSPCFGQRWDRHEWGQSPAALAHSRPETPRQRPGCPWMPCCWSWAPGSEWDGLCQGRVSRHWSFVVVTTAVPCCPLQITGRL